MKSRAEKLRDQAAEPILNGIRQDRQRASEKVELLLRIVEENLFDRDFDVNALWRKAGLRKGTASPAFTEEMGRSPGTYITDFRMRVAKALLLGSRLKVYVIGGLVGYSRKNDAFSKAFRGWSGKKPTEFRLAHGVRDGGAGELGARLEQAAEVASLTAEVDAATAAGDFPRARDCLARADALVLDRQIEELSGRLGLARHERGDQLLADGDVDHAWEDLSFAADCYADAGELSPAVLEKRRRIAADPDTDQALFSALCPECRSSLAADEGSTARMYLRQALLEVPRDLPWFQSCCDECYRVLWQAVSRARLGLVDDAWKAWWLSTHADLEDGEAPPSRGRIIAAFAKVEALVSGDQLERQGYCDLALADAVAIGDPRLEAEARIWLGTTLRGLGRFPEAREELRKAAEVSREVPWLSALQTGMSGMLEVTTGNYSKALDLMCPAAELYLPLDLHHAGIQLIHQGGVYFFLGQHEKSIDLYNSALPFLDDRRDPLTVSGVVPVNLAASFALLHRLDRAEAELAQCCFDRQTHRGLAATEVFTRACIELLRPCFQASLDLFAEAQEQFEDLHKPLDAALAVSYSVEAHARLGDRSRAIEKAAAALSFFEAAGCAQDALEALGKLRALLEAEEMDVRLVAATVRRLARRHGGWLPELEPS